MRSVHSAEPRLATMQVFDYSDSLKFVPSHLAQLLGEHRMLMDVVACLLEDCLCVCVLCMHLFAYWCWSLLLGTGIGLPVCVCVALSGENERLHIAWNSQAWFWKKGPQHLLMCPPLHSCAASPLARTGPSIRLMVFDGQKYDGHKTLSAQQPGGTKHNSFSVYVCGCTPCVS